MASTINAISTGAGGLISTGDASGQLQLQTTGTTAVTIDASQNVGIGTTSPGYKLDVNGVIKGNNLLSLQAGSNSFPASGYGWEIYNLDSSNNVQQSYNRTGSAWMNSVYGALSHQFKISGSEAMRIDTSGNVGIGTTSPYSGYPLTVSRSGGAGMRTIDGANSADFVLVGTDAYISNNNSAGNIIFYRGAERMRIDNNGYVGVNTTANSYGQFAIKFDATAAGNNGTGIGIYPTAATSGAKFMYFYSEVGGGLGTITRNGTAGSVLYNTTSDYRLKTDITPIDNALSIVNQLNPVSYTWTGTEQKDTGFIAHELQAVIPSIVTGEKDAVDEKGNPVYQVVDYSKLVATLTAAIKEQQTIINDLKARVTALEGAQ